MLVRRSNDIDAQAAKLLLDDLSCNVWCFSTFADSTFTT